MVGEDEDEEYLPDPTYDYDDTQNITLQDEFIFDFDEFTDKIAEGVKNMGRFISGKIDAIIDFFNNLDFNEEEDDDSQVQSQSQATERLDVSSY